MRTAFCPAIAAKQGLQVSGGRPALARSWLISDCWVAPMIGAGRTTGWATVAVAWVAAGVDGVEAGVADGVTGASRVRQSCFGKGGRWTAAGAGLAAPASGLLHRTLATSTTRRVMPTRNPGWRRLPETMPWAPLVSRWDLPDGYSATPGASIEESGFNTAAPRSGDTEPIPPERGADSGRRQPEVSPSEFPPVNANSAKGRPTAPHRRHGNGCGQFGKPTPLTPDSKPRPHVTVGLVDFDITEAIFQFAYPLDRLPPRGPAPACTAQPTSQAAPQQPLPDQ